MNAATTLVAEAGQRLPQPMPWGQFLAAVGCAVLVGLLVRWLDTGDRLDQILGSARRASDAAHRKASGVGDEAERWLRDRGEQ